MAEEIKKRRILVWADSPTVATGFAQVSRNILKELHKSGRYIIDMIGINYFGEYDRNKFQEQFGFLNVIVPAQQQGDADMYGRAAVLAAIAGRNPSLEPPYDLFFSIQDHFVIGQKDATSMKGLGQAIKILQKNTLETPEFRENHFLWVGYYPVDGDLKHQWVSEAIGTCDYPVAYCEYGRKQIVAHDTDGLKIAERINVIHHGTNTTDFYPVDAETRKKWRAELFKERCTDETFVLMNVARNQPRKDLFRTLMIFREWLKTHPDSLLYLHCDPLDPSGGNLFDMMDLIHLDRSRVMFSKGFSSTRGVTIDQLNKVYNCADAFLTTTLGEGWGLPITEAMACKVPVYAPNITSISDILDTHGGFNPQIARGMVFSAGSTPTEWINAGASDNEIPRPITNVESALAMLQWGYDNRDKVAQIVERGYEFVKNNTWEHTNEQWLKVFDEACAVNDRLRSGVGVETRGHGRNDLCPLCLANGKEIKIKKCEQHRSLYLK